MEQKNVLLCLEGDLEVSLVQAIQRRRDITVARRCADLIEAEAAMLAGIGNVVICADNPDLSRDFLSKCVDSTVSTIILSTPDRVEDLLHMGAFLVMHEYDADSIIASLEGLADLEKKPASGWSSLSPGDEQMQAAAQVDESPLYIADIVPADHDLDETQADGSSNQAQQDEHLGGEDDSESEPDFRFPSRATRAFSTGHFDMPPPPPEGASSLAADSEDILTALNFDGEDGGIVVIRGTGGAPGRSTFALGLAIELGRRGASTILIDADMRNASLGLMSGAQAQWAGIAVACRMASRGRLDTDNLSHLLHALGPNSHLITGLSRADRWREIKGSDFTALLECASDLAQYVLVDTCDGLIEETDEYDQIEQKSAVCEIAVSMAKAVVSVGKADPVGVSRMLALLDQRPVSGEIVVMNRVNPVASGPDAMREILKILGSTVSSERVVFVPEEAAVQASLFSARPLYEVKKSEKVIAAFNHIIDLFSQHAGPSKRESGIRKYLSWLRRG